MVSFAAFAALTLSLLSENGIVVGLHTGRVFQLRRNQQFRSYLSDRYRKSKGSSSRICNLLEDDSVSQLELTGTSYETVLNRDVDVIQTESGILRNFLPFSQNEESVIESAAISPPQNPLLSKSFLFLNAVAIIWGTQHVVIKTALESFPSPSVLNFWRFSLSLLLFLPACISVVVSKVLHSCFRLEEYQKSFSEIASDLIINDCLWMTLSTRMFPFSVILDLVKDASFSSSFFLLQSHSLPLTAIYSH
jgi:hypothetical protein